jgi:hypothetical protein
MLNEFELIHNFDQLLFLTQKMSKLILATNGITDRTEDLDSLLVERLELITKVSENINHLLSSIYREEILEDLSFVQKKINCIDKNVIDQLLNEQLQTQEEITRLNKSKKNIQNFTFEKIQNGQFSQSI